MPENTGMFKNGVITMNIFQKIKKSVLQSVVYCVVSKSKLFDKDWYVSKYPEIGKADPLMHYLKEGWKQGRNPSPYFSTEKYLTAYPSVRSKDMNPLKHYLFHGKKRGFMCFSVNQQGMMQREMLNTTPLISVVVASYNYEEFLPQTLDSILSQTYTNYEVIVVDDGSKDGSLDVLNKYVSEHENIRIFTHPGNVNQGLSKTIQLGLKHAQGEFIAFCESDDYWMPTYLEKKVEVINRYQDVKIISNDIKLFGDVSAVEDRKGYLNYVSKILSEGGNWVDLYGNKGVNYIPTFSAVMIRKDILLHLDFNTPVQAWLDFWLYRQILKNELLFYIPEKLTCWRQHDSFNGAFVAEVFFAKHFDLFIYLSDRLTGISLAKRTMKNLAILRKSKLFDEAYYNKQYANLLDGVDPLIHYMFLGWKLGCNPSSDFSTDVYLSQHADLCQYGVNPLVHYERFRKKEALERYPAGMLPPLSVQENDIDFFAELGKKTKTVLLLSHEMSLSGAPRALLNMAIAIRKSGAEPVILSLKYGLLEKELEDLNIRYFVEPTFSMFCAYKASFLARFLSTFHVVVFNTIATVGLIKFFSDIKVRKICWLHEGKFAFEHYGKLLNFSVLFPLFDKVYAVGEYSKSFASAYIEDKKNLDILLYGIPDINLDVQNQTIDSTKVNFLLPGTLSIRKGQLVLLEALKMLPFSVCNQISVYVAGQVLDRHVATAVKKCGFACVKYVGELEHDSLLQLFCSMDMMMAPSLDDPMPIVCTEAMALCKGVIVSDHTGTASYIEDGINGYVIPVDNPQALAKTIEQCVLNKNKLPALGKAARRIYDEHFTMEVFESNVNKLIL